MVKRRCSASSTNRARSSIQVVSLHGIEHLQIVGCSSVLWSVTYVPGLICYLCARSVPSSPYTLHPPPPPRRGGGGGGCSICLQNQASTVGDQGWFERTMALRMTSSFRIQAVSASLRALPRASRCW